MENESKKDRVSDSEDIPSDFFDDFNKEEFMEGLSVIDSWDDEGKLRRQPRVNADGKGSVNDETEHGSRMRMSDGQPPRQKRSRSKGRIDEYIKPGSRRDPSKTIAAIRRDKEEKVKEYLAKQIESTDDIKPPGTELDDFFDEKPAEKKVVKKMEAKPKPANRSRSHERRQEPSGGQKHWQESSGGFRHRQQSPGGQRYQRMGRFRRSPNRLSPRRSPYRPRRFSPGRRYREQSPHRRSPIRRPLRSRHSPSPQRRSYNSRRSRSRSPSKKSSKDNFLYPEMQTSFPGAYNAPAPAQFPPPLVGMEYPPTTYGYPQPQGYPSGYPGSYNYSSPPMAVPMPEAPVPPYIAPGPVAPPQPVPAPSTSILMGTQLTSPSPNLQLQSVTDQKTPYDALAQLVADGKISKEDYLKLAPNKGAKTHQDDKNRVAILNRCHEALGKLENLSLPNRLLMNIHLLGPEPQSLAPKFCSPLKRQAAVEFHFTKKPESPSQQNNQLIESIIAAIGADKLITKQKKKTTPGVEVAVQTSKPACDVCFIRESTKFRDVGTSTDPDQFSTSVHTQVVEQELMSSRSVFNPSGGIADGAPISIAHMTPAQLVSQLAARAKTLKQTSETSRPSQDYSRNYDYEGRASNQNQYQNNYHYRY